MAKHKSSHPKTPSSSSSSSTNPLASTVVKARADAVVPAALKKEQTPSQPVAVAPVVKVDPRPVMGMTPADYARQSKALAKKAQNQRQSALSSSRRSSKSTTSSFLSTYLLRALLAWFLLSLFTCSPSTTPSTSYLCYPATRYHARVQPYVQPYLSHAKHLVEPYYQPYLQPVIPHYNRAKSVVTPTVNRISKASAPHVEAVQRLTKRTYDLHLAPRVHQVQVRAEKAFGPHLNMLRLRWRFAVQPYIDWVLRIVRELKEVLEKDPRVLAARKKAGKMVRSGANFGLEGYSRVVKPMVGRGVEGAKHHWKKTLIPAGIKSYYAGKHYGYIGSLTAVQKANQAHSSRIQPFFQKIDALYLSKIYYPYLSATFDPLFVKAQPVFDTVAPVITKLEDGVSYVIRHIRELIEPFYGPVYARLFAAAPTKPEGILEKVKHVIHPDQAHLASSSLAAAARTLSASASSASSVAAKSASSLSSVASASASSASVTASSLASVASKSASSLSVQLASSSSSLSSLASKSASSLSSVASVSASHASSVASVSLSSASSVASASASSASSLASKSASSLSSVASASASSLSSVASYSASSASSVASASLSSASSVASVSASKRSAELASSSSSLSKHLASSSSSALSHASSIAASASAAAAPGWFSSSSTDASDDEDVEFLTELASASDPASVQVPEVTEPEMPPLKGEDDTWAEGRQKEKEKRVAVKAMREEIERKLVDWEMKLERVGGVEEEKLVEKLAAIRSRAVSHFPSPSLITSLESSAASLLASLKSSFHLTPSTLHSATTTEGLNDAVSKAVEGFSKKVDGGEEEVTGWLKGVEEEEERAVREGEGVVDEIVREAQEALGPAYAWLEDVTAKDWTRYHGLAEAATSIKSRLSHHSSSQTSHPLLSTPSTDLTSPIASLRSTLHQLESGFAASAGLIKNDFLRQMINTQERNEDSGYESTDESAVPFLAKGAEQVREALRSAGEAVGVVSEEEVKKQEEEERIAEKAAEKLKAAFNWFAHGSL